MYIYGSTLDDLLRKTYEKLLKSSNRIQPTKGATREITGALLKIGNPRARLSRTEMKGKPFSCLGELLWYLAKTDKLDFIKYYIKDYEKSSDDGRTVYGAYGPRLFKKYGVDQIASVVSILQKKPPSRQAVIQLFGAEDIVKVRKDVPCTCTLQFMIRKKRLHMFTCMRSNDAFKGLPHDVFAFTMLQEIIARKLQIEPGPYMHAVGSLHLYDDDRLKAERFLDEGWQSTVLMPPMPLGDPEKSIKELIRIERRIRLDGPIDLSKVKLDDYWLDLVRLLQIFSHFKRKEVRQISQLKKAISVRVYDAYIDQKKQSVTKRPKGNGAEQLRLL